MECKLLKRDLHNRYQQTTTVWKLLINIKLSDRLFKINKLRLRLRALSWLPVALAVILALAL
jgi:hypothetical protein